MDRRQPRRQVPSTRVQRWSRAARLGRAAAAGCIQSGFVREGGLEGRYAAAKRLMKVVVLGKRLDALERLEWAAGRKEGKLAGGKPVGAVAFVFPKEAEAKKNLDRL